MTKKIGVTVYFKQKDHEAFKKVCKDNDVTMAAKLLEKAKAYTKKESKQ